MGIPVAVGVVAGVDVRTGVGVAERTGVRVGVAVLTTVAVGVAVLTGVGVAVLTGVGVAVGIAVGEGVMGLPFPKVNVIEFPIAPTLLIFSPEAEPLHQLELGVVVLSNRVLLPE